MLHQYLLSRSPAVRKRTPAPPKYAASIKAKDDYNAAAIRASVRVFVSTYGALKLWDLVKTKLIARGAPQYVRLVSFHAVVNIDLRQTENKDRAVEVGQLQTLIISNLDTTFPPSPPPILYPSTRISPHRQCSSVSPTKSSSRKNSHSSADARNWCFIIGILPRRMPSRSAQNYDSHLRLLASTRIHIQCVRRQRLLRRQTMVVWELDAGSTSFWTAATCIRL